MDMEGTAEPIVRTTATMDIARMSVAMVSIARTMAVTATAADMAALTTGVATEDAAGRDSPRKGIAVTCIPLVT